MQSSKYKLLVKPSMVKALVQEDYHLRKNYGEDSEKVHQAQAGDLVTILQDRSYKWYQIRLASGRVGWIPRSHLWIPPDDPTNLNRLTRAEIEGYIAHQNLSSKTEYLVWVDIHRQMTYILRKKEDQWQLEKEIPCTTGKNISPTKRGKYQIKDRGHWFYSERFDSGAMYWVRYSGSYLFHSVAMNASREITDDTIGKKSSAGCIRMTIEDSQWFHKTIPKKTTVYIH